MNLRQKADSKKSGVLLRGLFLSLLPVIVYIPFYLMRGVFFRIADGFSPCAIRKKYGILCPGCGNTHCVEAMLSLHFIKAIEYNLTIPLFLGIFLFYYYAWILKTSGVAIKRVIKPEFVMIGVLVVLFAYYILRNIV